MLTAIQRRKIRETFPDNAFADSLMVAMDHPNIAGNVYFVDSTQTASQLLGTMDQPMLTIAAALALCTANNGDYIFLLPTHAQTITTAGMEALNVAGVTVRGLGNGADRPALTFSGSTGASVTITAAGTRIINVLGVSGIDGLTNPFHVQAADCELDITWRDSTDDIEAARAVLGTAAADRLKCRLVYEGRTGGNACVNAIRLVGTDKADIEVDFYGKASTAVVEFITTACTNVKVSGRIYNSGTTNGSKNVVDTQGSSTWSADLWDETAGLKFSGSSGRALAADDAPAGSQFVIQSTVVSSSIPNNTQTAGAITGAASGVILVENIIFETGTTGIVAPTNIEITTDNVSGLTGAGAPHVLQAVSGLGANKTIVGSAVANAKLPFTLESGKKIFIHGDDAAGTGAGTARITMLCRRLTAGASLAAANLP